MARYLIHLSYMATHFKSFTTNWLKGIPVEPTVMGVLESALSTLKPQNPLKLVSISRTDRGVHALHAAIVVDLARENGRAFNSQHILHKMHKYLESTDHDLRINRVQMVPNDFNTHGRVVLSRTYMYRLAVAKQSIRQPKLEERKRFYFICSNDFSVDRLREAAHMMVGTHDFRSFMNENSASQKSASFATRTIFSIDVVPGRASTLQICHNSADDIEYWDIIFRGRSYVHRQIRCMVGTLVSYALGKMTKRDIYEQITIPSKHHSGCTRIHAVPPHGLYLANIEFSENAMRMQNHDLNDNCEKQLKVPIIANSFTKL